MLPDDTAPIMAPTLPEAAAPYAFPVVATLAPVVLSGLAWWLTQSVLSLVFAALGPLIAIGSLVDARLQSRRKRRREGARFRSELESARAEVEQAHGVERARAQTMHPAAPPAPRWTELADDPLPVRLGTGTVPSVVRLDGVPPLSRSPSPEARQLDELRRATATLLDAPVLAQARAGIGVVGPELPATALARSIVLQLAARLSPAEWSLEVQADAGWEWLRLLPHAVEFTPAHSAPRGAVVLRWVQGEHRLSLALSGAPGGLPGGLDTILDLGTRRVGEAVLENALRLSVEEARLGAGELQQAARDRGLEHAGARLPERVQFRDLEQPSASLAAVIGVGENGPLPVDLVRDGPHAVVGGTTGSGKSELLISWLLALASSRSPDVVNLLLVDFKGGAAFGALAGLPHCVGIVTDLDDDTAERALESLAAELRYRERALAQAGVRSVEQLPALARLVIVVDEYAAVAQGYPHLHALFSDLAARGRSLGIHLVLCTQRPSGVVRDAVLANSGLRISLRVNNRSDSSAVIGVDDAAHIPAAARGRALLAAHGEKPVAVQLALATPADVDAVLETWREGAWRPRRPWRDPLPARVSRHELPTETSEGIPFGLADRPAEQAQPAACWKPREHGHLLVVGGAGSGRSTALATIAVGARELARAAETRGGAGSRVCRISARSAEAAWDLVSTLLDGVRAETNTPTVLLIDDLDALITRLGEEHRIEFAERLAALLREGSARGVHAVLAVQRVTGALGGVAALTGSRLLLRLPDRQEHVLAGGSGDTWRERLPPGAGTWLGHRVQVAVEEGSAEGQAPHATVPEPAEELPRLSPFRPGDHPLLAVVAARALETAHRLVAAGVDPVSITRDRVDVQVGTGERQVLLADPDGWQAHWGAVASLRARMPILFDGCSLSDYRALTRERTLPPPLVAGADQAWLLTPDGVVRRVGWG